jgi:hypothetical protein
MMDSPIGPPTRAAYIAERNAPDPYAEMICFARAEPLTGEILSTGRCPRPSLATLAAFDGGLYVETDGLVLAEEAYVSLGTLEVLPRTPNPARLTGLSLTGLPLDGMLVVTSAAERIPRSFDITTPSLTLSFEHPGAYRIDVKSVRHRDASFEVTV